MVAGACQANGLETDTVKMQTTWVIKNKNTKDDQGGGDSSVVRAPDS